MTGNEFFHLMCLFYYYRIDLDISIFENKPILSKNNNMIDFKLIKVTKETHKNLLSICSNRSNLLAFQNKQMLQSQLQRFHVSFLKSKP